jgi:transcriptional regulator with XRE-family HTH domain
MTETEGSLLALAVGERLRWVRLLSDYTQEEIATSTGGQGRWSRWERGIRVIPVKEALEFCRRMQVSMDYIYRGHLTGVHPELAERLYALYPDKLRLPPPFTGWIPHGH